MQNKKSLRVVFFGTPEFVVPVLDSLHQHFQLVGVVTTPDAAVGRKQIVTSSAIGHRAIELKIPAIKDIKLDEITADKLKELSPDLFIVASYGKIIPQVVLDVPKYGSINIHPSKLPLFRGATPIQSQVLEGIIDSAISFILVDAKMDHGPLLHQEDFSISPSDTNETLHNSMFIKSAEILPELIEQYVDGKITPIEQNHEEATFCKPFNRESGYFELDNPPTPEKLDQMIRGLYPWPTAWTRWKSQKYAEHDASRSKVKSQKEMIIKFLPDNMVQPEGKKPMKWKEFLNGYPNFPYPDLLN